MEKGPVLIRADKLGNQLRLFFEKYENPFRQNPLIRFLSKTGENIGDLLEKLTGKELYVKVPPNKSLAEKISPKFKDVLSYLREEELADTMVFGSPPPDWPEIPVFVLKNNDITAAGSGTDYNEAVLKAVGEFFERISLMEYSKQDFRWGSFSELKNEVAVDPNIFLQFSPKQGIEKVSPESNFFWTKAESLFTGKKVLIPAQFFHIKYDCAGKEKRIMESTSNGAAAGNSYEMALYNALCEAVERDSILIHWLNKISPPKLDIEELYQRGNGRIKSLISLYKKYGIKAYFFDVTTDLKIPSIMTLVKPEMPGRSLAQIFGKADMDWETALEGSLREGLRAGYWEKADFNAPNDNEKAKYSNIKSLWERRAFWNSQNRDEELLFLTESKRKAKIPAFGGQTEFDERLENLKKILQKNHHEIFVADIASPSAKKWGISVLKILAPSLCQFYLNENFKQLGARRIFETPALMGLAGFPKKEEEINPVPHPML